MYYIQKIILCRFGMFCFKVFESTVLCFEIKLSSIFKAKSFASFSKEDILLFLKMEHSYHKVTLALHKNSSVMCTYSQA